uniref:Tensin 3 n=1 Tax=Sander lucioperca TaxID=283035 RepID=A0A8C9XJ74_SANLU
MEEGYELDLTYITERIIAVSFPRGCTEEIYSHNLKDVTRMLKSKHADNYLIINLSEKRHDLTKMNPKTLDTGWPDMHAPPLDKICTICKAMESWLNADPLHVVVIHCRGGKGRIGVVISSFVHFTDVSASADQALDRFAMRKYYDDKVSALMTPSQKRYVWILNSLLSGSMKINASPLFLHCVILHGIPNFDLQLPMNIQKKKAFSKFLTSVLIVVITLMYFLLQIKCYHKGDVTSDREVIFRLQFHTGAVQGYNLMFEKEDMETANKDPRFADYGKVELVFSEGPERIPGRFLTLLDADRWQNGADVIVDYNTADPLIRWDSYQNICDGEGLTQDKAANKRSPSGGEATLGRGARTTSATSSPDHSDHALSVSSDSGLSSTSLWADRPTPVPTPTTTTTTTIRPNQGPSQQEKVQLKRLLSGFGLDDPSLREMGDQGPIVGIQQIVPAQVHINGDPRPRERETDILDDEVITGHDLHSVDSLGTLSSSCHKSSQNSLLSDGFGSPGGEEQQSQSQHHLHHPAHPPMEEYERAYAEARRGCLSSRSNSVASANPSSAPMPKQHVYRQGSYSTQSWVRQQQMVAAQQFIYMAEDGNETERYPGNKQGSSSPKAGLLTEPQGLSRDMTTDAMTNTAPHNKQATMNNNNNNKRDEEFKSLTMDIDNSIDQLNQLIMDLDPTFAPVSSHSSSIKRNGGTHVNGSVSKCSNGINLRFNDNNAATLKNTQVGGDRGVQGSADILPLCAPVSGKYSVCTQCIMALSPFMNHFILYGWLHVCVCCLLQHPLLYRTDSVDYRGPDMDSGVEAGSDMTPPTPAFPISPPTPYGKYCMFPVKHLTCKYVSFIINFACICDQLCVVGLIKCPCPCFLCVFSEKQPPPHSMSLDYGHHSPPLHHPHIHPAPNAHSSPRSSQRSCMARYALSRSPAQSFDEQDDSGHGYGTDCPNTNSNLLGNGGMDRELLTSMDGLTQLQLPQMLPPVLPEKKRASDGEHSLGTASPALSGFSSPHSGSSLSIPFPNVLPDLSAQALGTASPLPGNKQVTVKFVQDTSKYWYKPDISRDQAISVLKDKDPGCFIVRDSHSFRGAYGLAMKVATPPPSVLQQTKKGGDLSNELVRHFLIECTQKGVRLKGCPNEPYFGSLTALVCQHSITPLALPCKLIIPDRDPLEDVVETTSQLVTNSAAELLKQGAACNVWYLGSVEMESLTGAQAVQKATSMSLSANPPPTSTVVHFKVSSQGITLTDNQRKLFFRRHYNVNTVIFCALDPQDRKWNKDGCPSAKIFGFVARKTGTSMDNVCHLFAEHDPEQPASAIVNFVSKVMIGSQKSK